MPTGATMAAPSKGNASSNQNAAPIARIPFPRAATLHTEPFVDVTTALLGANTQPFGPFDIPAYGYMRHIHILITTATSGAGVNGAGTEDAPFIAIQEIVLQDVNGAPIFGPVSGYDLYLATKYGSYEFSCDPRQSPSFSAIAATGNFAFAVKVPVEIVERDALGSLANQNASSTYKLRFTINNAASIYSVAPTVSNPSLRVRCFLEAWTQPSTTDLRGMLQETSPMAHGTSQYWSKYTATGLNGAQTVRMTRVGNYIRNVIFVCRRNASTRANGETDFPDPAQTYWDTRLLHNYTKSVWRDVIKQRTGYTAAAEAAGGPDNGVFVYDFCHEFDGKLGRELREGYLPTVQSTRLELQGSFGNTDNLDIITNDVAAAGEIWG